MGLTYTVKAKLPASQEKIDLTALINTGTHHCIITKEMATKVNLFPPNDPRLTSDNQVIRDAFNGSMPVLGVCSLEIQMNLYPNPSDPPEGRVFPIIADIVEALDFKATLYDPKVDLILGADFLESNYIGIDFFKTISDTHQDGVVAKIMQRPFFDQARIFQELPDHNREYFAMATTTNPNVPPIFPQMPASQSHWYDVKFLLPVSGSLGSKTLRIGLNPFLSYSIISAQAVDHLVPLRLLFEPETLEEDEKDLKMELSIDPTTTLTSEKFSRIWLSLKNRKISFMVFVVDEIPHDFDVVIGGQEIDAEGLMILDNDLISKYIMTKM